VSDRLKGALLIGQSGGPTAVINASLVGAIQEAITHEQIERVYGMLHGIEGVIHETLIDLGRERPETIQGLLTTPSSALGSCRHKVTDADYERILQVIKAHSVRFFAYIGGNDSMDTAARIAQAADRDGYELRVMGIPKTIDNDLDLTDHTPGYGSAARFIALAVMDVGRDLEAMKTFDNVIIMETLGRHAGWLPAAAALAKTRPEEAPHLIYVPERPFHEADFLQDVSAVYKDLGYVFVVVPAFLRDPQGDIVGADKGNVVKDAFGHTLMSQSSSTPATYLRGLVAQRLGLKARVMLPGLIGRDSSSCVSQIDRAEAYLVGQVAVRCAVQGTSGCMVTLVRKSGAGYACITGLAPLDAVANAEKLLPTEFINDRCNGITQAYCDYARPLLGPMPTYARLEECLVTRRLGV
jgi:ATP-dependent phosphofructokinase / diphosphate-dependent phosphofructokinase